MKIISCCLFFLSAICPQLAAQDATPYKPSAYTSSLNSNLICTWEAYAVEKSVTTLPVRARHAVRQTTTYVDGLGRPIQQVTRKSALKTDPLAPTSSALATDYIELSWYDLFGRTSRSYSPYAATTNTGEFRSDPFEEQRLFYTGTGSPIAGQGETFFYKKLEYENSSLDRVERDYRTGGSWVNSGSVSGTTDRSIKTKYLSNTTTDQVVIWNVFNNGTLGIFGTYQSNGYYPANSLSKKITEDEDGKQTIEFSDKNGLLILKKTQASSVTENGTGSGHEHWLCTYYIYDDLQQLRAVVQPKATELMRQGGWNFTSDMLKELCFRYEYDERGRVIVKKSPGAGEVFMVYDARDHVILTQDAKMRASGTWKFFKYDQLDRPILSGLYTNNVYVTQHAMQTHVNGQGMESFEKLSSTSFPLYSLNQSFPVVSISNVHTIYYYDDYAWTASGPLGFGTFDNSFNSYFAAADDVNFPYPQAVTPHDKLLGYKTGKLVRQLGGDFLWNVLFYDEAGRVIQEKSQNITGGVDITTTQYNFTGLVLSTVKRFQKLGGTAATHTILTANTYDEIGRLVKVEKNINNTGVRTMAAYEYDQLGLIRKKSIGNRKNLAGSYTGVPVEEMDYDYNLDGWLLGMNRAYLNDKGSPGYQERHFGLELAYDKLPATPGASLLQQTFFNGNHFASVWKSCGDQVRRQYYFLYDEANRLGKADYYENRTPTAGGSWSSTDYNFSVRGLDSDNQYKIKYDYNGNILGMASHGWKLDKGLGYISNNNYLIDMLRYEYFPSSNKTMRVSDDYSDPDTRQGDFHDGTQGAGGTDYGYDVNGNLVTDFNKYINGTTGLDVSGGGGIAYNYLNLPETVTIDGKGTIQYLYDAEGNKLRKIITDNTVTPAKTTTILYIQGQVYENDLLQFIAQEEGRFRYNPGAQAAAAFEFDFFIKDHLGNVRMVLTEEKRQDIYPAATLEHFGSFPAQGQNDGSPYAYERDFYSINTSKIVNRSNVSGLTNAINYTNENNNGTAPRNNNPNCSDVSTIKQTDLSEKLYELKAISASSTADIGLGMTIRVTAGDKIDIFGKSFYNQNNASGANYNVPLLSLLNAFLGTPTGATAGKGVTGADMNGQSSIVAEVTNFLGSVLRNNGDVSGNGTTPKAYINYILFDEHFNFVAGDFSRVGAPNAVKNHYNDLAMQNISVEKNGFLYVYVSNESPVSVYFDNLQVVHTKGHMLEETHYYPFGLPIAAISHKALTMANKAGFNGNEIQNNEFSDGTGWENYDFNARTYDPQTGRFLQIDPLADDGVQGSVSPYHFGLNNPVRYSDPDGKFAFVIPVIWVIVAKYAVDAAIVTTVSYMTAQTIREAYNYYSSQSAGSEAYNYYSKNDADYNMGSTGSYTNHHLSGKRYHGKGPYSRAEQSAKEKESTYNDPLIYTDWTPARDDVEAFIDEANRLWNDGGPDNPDNYNKRDSPGSKHLEEAAIYLMQNKERQAQMEDDFRASQERAQRDKEANKWMTELTRTNSARAAEQADRQNHKMGAAQGMKNRSAIPASTPWIFFGHRR